MSSKKRIITTVIALLGSLALIFCVYKTKQLYFDSKISSTKPLTLTSSPDIKNSLGALTVPKLKIFKNPVLQSEQLKSDKRLKPDLTVNESDVSSDQQIITHKYMIKVLSQQQSFLRRCFENHLRSNPEPVDKGTLVVEFMVLPFGEIRDVEIKDSNFKDPTFENCIKTVFLRTQVKKFNGEKFLITFPLEFE